ncbi:hypothetical protein ACD578_27075 (plasmid) [Microvirga sp. RSM25]|uniref:hypothetical protein n=1 Tax=Microvirga sp. RSM25 TaxID=3273802 RepID=UPI00384F883D
MTSADHSPCLANIIFERILAGVQPPEAPNTALARFALYWLIVDGTKAGTTVTTAKLGQQTQIRPSRLLALAERLEPLGLITRERITVSHGKGRAWAYQPVLPTDLTAIALDPDEAQHERESFIMCHRAGDY